MASITAAATPGHRLLSIDVFDWSGHLLAHANSNPAGSATATVSNGSNVVAVVHRQGAPDEVTWKRFNPDGSLSPANNKPLVYVNVGAVPAGGSVTYYKSDSSGHAIAATAVKTIDSAGATSTGDFNHSGGAVKLPILAGESGWFEVRNAAGVVTACYRMIHAGQKVTGPYKTVAFQPVNQPYLTRFTENVTAKVWTRKGYVGLAQPVKLNKGESIRIQMYRGAATIGAPFNIVVGKVVSQDVAIATGKAHLTAKLEGSNFVLSSSFTSITELEPRKSFGFDPFPYLGGDLDLNGYVGPEDGAFKNKVIADLNSPVLAVKNRAIAYINAALSYKTNEQKLRAYCDGHMLAADGNFYLEPGQAASAGRPAVPPSHRVTFAMVQGWRDACSRSFATMKAQYDWVNDAANGPTTSFHNLFDTINPATGYLGQANAALKAKIASNYRLFQQFDNFLPDVSGLVNGQTSAEIGDLIFKAIQNAAKGFAAIGLVAVDFNNDMNQALKAGLTPLEIGKAIDPTLSNNGAIHLALGLGTKIDAYARGKMVEWATKIKQLTTKYVQCYEKEQKAQKAADLNNMLNFLFDGLSLLLGGAASLTSIAMQFGRTLSVARNEYKLATIFQKFKLPNKSRMYSDEQVAIIAQKFKGLQPAQAKAKFDSINMCTDPDFPVTVERKPGWLASDGPDFINLGVSNYNLGVGAQANNLVQTSVGFLATKFSYHVNDFLNSSKDGYYTDNAVDVTKLGEVADIPAFAQNIRNSVEFKILSRRVTEAVEQLINIGGAGETFYTWAESYTATAPPTQTSSHEKEEWSVFLQKIGITAAVPAGRTLNWRGYVYVLQITTQNHPESHSATATYTIKRMATPF